MFCITLLFFPFYIKLESKSILTTKIKHLAKITFFKLVLFSFHVTPVESGNIVVLNKQTCSYCTQPLRWDVFSSFITRALFLILLVSQRSLHTTTSLNLFCCPYSIAIKLKKLRFLIDTQQAFSSTPSSLFFHISGSSHASWIWPSQSGEIGND